MARLEFAEAVSIIQGCQQAIAEAEQVLAVESDPEVRAGAERRIRVYRHSVAAMFAYFEQDTQARLEEAVSGKPLF